MPECPSLFCVRSDNTNLPRKTLAAASGSNQFLGSITRSPWAGIALNVKRKPRTRHLPPKQTIISISCHSLAVYKTLSSPKYMGSCNKVNINIAT